MISQPAIICLEASWRRLFHRGDDRALTVPPETQSRGDVPASLAPSIAAVAAGESVLATEPERDSPAASDPSGPLTAAERRARAAALRALALSRGRRIASAEVAFTEAANLDPRLDLTRTPSFWTLERAAHEAAIAAYVAVGRDRDAAVLRAQVRSTFRPKALRPQSQPLPTS